MHTQEMKWQSEARQRVRGTEPRAPRWKVSTPLAYLVGGPGGRKGGRPTVLCPLSAPRVYQGRLVSLSRGQGQPEHLSNASKSFNQRPRQSGTQLWEAGRGQEGFAVLQRLTGRSQNWTQMSCLVPALLRSPQALRVVTAISTFPFSITLCSSVSPSESPELC